MHGLSVKIPGGVNRRNSAAAGNTPARRAPRNARSGGTNLVTIIPLAWDAPLVSTPDYYKVQYRTPAGSGPFSEVSTPDNSTTWNLYVGNHPSTTYEIQIVSHDSINGDSDPSPSITQTTAATFSPVDLSPLAWYDADHVSITSGQIDSYTDRTGNGRTVSYVSGTKRTIDSTLGCNMTKLVAVDGRYEWSTGSPVSIPAGLIGIWCGVSANDNIGVMARADWHGDQRWNFETQSGAFKARGSVWTANSLNNNIPFCFVADEDYTNQNVRTWTNGDSSGQATNAYVVGGTDLALIRLQYDDGNFGQAGQLMRSAIWYQHGLSDADINKVMAYLLWEVPNGNKQLPNAHPYRYTSPSGVVVPPTAPISVLASAGDGQVTLTIIPGSDGGGDVTYTITPSVGGSHTTSTLTRTNNGWQYTYTGLTNFTPVYFTVVATNIAGSSSGTVSNTVTPNNLGVIASYHLAESSGADATDNVGGYTLTHSGTPGSGAGKIGNGRTFAGSDYLKYASPLPTPISCNGTDFTVSGWFKPTSLSGNHQVVTCRNSGTGVGINYMVRTEGTNLVLYIGDGGSTYTAITLATGLSTGTGYGFAFNVDKTTKAVRGSVNGGAIVTGTASAVPATNNLNFGIGGIDGNETFSGTIDCVNVANVKWSDADLQTYSTNGLEI